MANQQAFRNSLVSILLALACAFPVAPVLAADAQPAEPPPVDRALLTQLRQGGFVIFFRHAPTELSNKPDSVEDIARCETQRNLSAAGRKLARDIGRTLKALHIPIGDVRSSPFCRCRDTARLAFGSYSIDDKLYFALNTDAEARRQYADAMRRMLATAPRPGTNTVLVSHTANLREATGYWPKPEGAAYVFQPAADGTYTAIARMEPDDWRALLSGREQ